MQQTAKSTSAYFHRSKQCGGDCPSSKYRTKPFSRFLALGHPQLETVFFQMGVLGRYQSDPRYIFRFDGLDGHIGDNLQADGKNSCSL